MMWEVLALVVVLALGIGSITYKRRRSPMYRHAEKQLDQLLGRETIDRMLRGEFKSSDFVAHVPARIVMHHVVPAGEIATLHASDEIIYLDVHGLPTGITEPKRTGVFKPLRLIIGENRAHFQIVDVRVGATSQFAHGAGPVPADLFDPRFSDLTDVTMDTLTPADAFIIEVRNTSDRELAFDARVEGRYVPNHGAEQ